MRQKAICHNSTDILETATPPSDEHSCLVQDSHPKHPHRLRRSRLRASLQLFNGHEMRLSTAALALLITTPVAAESVQFPITIPQECFELAQREGVPTVIENKMQATKAKLKLAQMKNSDHLVRECRAAVHRAQQVAAAQAGTPVRSQGAQAGGQPGFHGGFEAGARAAEARSQNN